MLEDGMTPEDILNNVLGDLGVEFLDTIPTGFNCNCSKERVEKVLMSLGRKELNDMINDGKDVELNCHFCNHNYKFTIDEIKRMVN
jgi:molecular chaperone Hsp33